MKDYAKLVNTTPREIREAQKTQPQEQPNLVRSAKELQPKENQGNKNIFGILLVVFILIAVGYGVVRQYFTTHHLNFSNGKISNEITQIKKSASSQNSVPQFDFYTVLPKGNVPTAPDNTQSAPAAQTTSTPAATTPATPTTTPASPPAAAPPSPPPAPTAPVTTINVSST